MFNKNIDQITEQDLQYLIDNSVIEWKTLDYKATLPGNSDQDKKEFLADVSSFANSVGGDIVFGIVCDNSTGLPKSLDGLSTTNFDHEILRLESSIRDGIEPRISAIAPKLVVLSSRKSALIIRILKSWNSPHRVTYKGHDKFYGRSTNGKYSLDVVELRNAFSLSSTLSEHIKNFRIDRINRILADDTPAPLSNNSKIVLHIVPLISFNPAQVYDISVVDQHPDKLPPIYSSGWDNRYNLDGVLTYSDERQGKYSAYTQLFKSGIIEAIEAEILKPLDNQRLTIPSVLFERELMKSLSAYLKLLKEIAIELPAYVFLSILGVRGYSMATSPLRRVKSCTIDRDHLFVPEAIIQNYDTEVKDILHQCFDSIWNACGFSRSLNYDENDNWYPNRA
jgi:hypothetical protein